MLFTVVAGAQVAKESGASGFYSLNNFSGQAPSAIVTAFNPAALSKIKNSSAGIFGEQRFLLKELAFYNFALAIQTKPGNFGINGYYSGSVEFNSMSVGAAYGRSLGEIVDIGIQFDYSSYKLKSYGKASFINVQMGSIFHLTEQFHAGIHIKNLAGFRSNQNSEKLNPLITVGIGFDVS